MTDSNRETANEKQIAFRLPETKKKLFLAAVKGQGLDIADVLVPCVDQFLASPDGGVGKHPPGSGTKGSLRAIPGGSTLSKSLVELIPKLERILARPDTRGALRVIVNNMAPSDAEVEVGAEDRKAKRKSQRS